MSHGFPANMLHAAPAGSWDDKNRHLDMTWVRPFKRTGTFSVCAIWGKTLLGPLSEPLSPLSLTHTVGAAMPEAL